MAQRVIFTPKPGEIATSTSVVAINTASFGIAGTLPDEVQAGFEYLTSTGSTPYVGVYVYVEGVKKYFAESQLDCFVEDDVFPDDIQDRLLALYDRNGEIANMIASSDGKLDTIITYLQITLTAQVLNLAATLVTMSSTLDGQNALLDRIHRDTKGISKGGAVR